MRINNKIWVYAVLFSFLIACEGKRVVKAPKPNMDPLPIKITVEKEEQDTFFQEQWNLEKISAPKVWEEYTSSKAVRIMLLGSGVDYNHEDLRANIDVNMKELKEKNPNNGSPFNGKDDDNDKFIDNFVGWDFVDNDGLAYDRYGYDTHLAGIIGAVHNNGKGIKGVLKKVSIYPVRYINNNGQSRIPTLVRALKHIVEVRPDVALVNLINLKISKNENIKKIEIKAIEQVLEKIQKSGIPVVIGAGNIHMELGSQETVHKIFCGYENIFVVTSVDKNEKKPFLANYSYQFVHTTAPGDEILTTAPDGQYKKVSSTSIAAAHVTAAIAFAISEHGSGKTYEDYFSALLSYKGSTEVDHLSKHVAGGNTLNLYKFLEALK